MRTAPEDGVVAHTAGEVRPVAPPAPRRARRAEQNAGRGKAGWGGAGQVGAGRIVGRDLAAWRLGSGLGRRSRLGVEGAASGESGGAGCSERPQWTETGIRANSAAVVEFQPGSGRHSMPTTQAVCRRATCATVTAALTVTPAASMSVPQSRPPCSADPSLSEP